jgi:nicotinamidase-related amidase
MRTTALIVVDAINSFFDEHGSAYYSESRDVLGNIERLLESARRNDIFRVHAVERHHPGVRDDEHKRLPRHCETGSTDAAYVVSLAPQLSPQEIEVGKIRFSAFLATELDFMLRAQGVSKVVIVGVKTNVCVRATAQDAFAHGYEVIVPSDSTNSNRPHLAAASLEDIARYMGSTPTTAEVLSMFESATE